MSPRILKQLKRDRYERLLPRLFPAAAAIGLSDGRGAGVWRFGSAESWERVSSQTVSWRPFEGDIEWTRLASGELGYRMPIAIQERGAVGHLVVTYDAKARTPIDGARASVNRAFDDAVAFIRDDIELQLECDQLAIELTERYEELNLVYSTKDHVEYFEESHEALLKLVHNCADYLDVGMAALICRDRGLVLHSAAGAGLTADSKSLLDLLGGPIYDRIQSQIEAVIVNELDDSDRLRLFEGRPENVLAHPILDNHGTAIGVLAVVARRDLHTFSNGDRNLLEVMAKKAARIIHTHHDSLTGLINRVGFESTLLASLAIARSSNVQHCLLHVDIDKLHVVNELLGHQEGDALIRRAAKLLQGLLRDSDVLARLGGDEFAVLLANCGIGEGRSVAEKIRAAIANLRVISANRQLDITASIGIVSVSKHSDGIVGLMASAEIACKAAKENGRDRIEVFARDNSTLMRRSEEVEWISRIQQALREHRFLLYCQPVLPIDPGEAPHYEVLVRMLDDDGVVLSPAVFMPAAERYQLMPLIDRWVIRNTLQCLSKVWDEVSRTGAIFCINLSGQSLTNPGFSAFVADEIERSALDPDRICFEITETAAISNIDEANEFICGTRALGCRFALDDFGAGLSSFGYLKMLDVDYLKIDGSFIREITTDDVSRSMVDAICQIGRTMGLDMIAEFVGDEATVALLREIGVKYVQGFHIGKPAPLRDVTDELRSPESRSA